VIGTATDPYQPAERRYRITRALLAVLADVPGLTVGIITKSPLVTRDIDVLRRLADRSRLTIHLSLITVDAALARRLEPRSPTPAARLRALARLREAGLDAGVYCMPVLPGITDGRPALADLVRQVARAGGTHVSACALRLPPAARERFFIVLRREFPELEQRYRSTWARGPMAHPRYREGLRRAIDALCRRYGVRAAGPGDFERTIGAGPAGTQMEPLESE
jgi:DNA repair photolyase